MHNFFTETTPLLEKYRQKGEAPKKTLIQLIDSNKCCEARQLIEHGADVNAIGEYQKTALHAAVRAKSVFTVEALIKAGANPDLVDKNNWTPLMDAVRLDDVLLVKLLIDKTKAINQVDVSGNTALDYAKEKSIIELLKQHGAKTANDVSLEKSLKF